MKTRLLLLLARSAYEDGFFYGCGRLILSNPFRRWLNPFKRRAWRLGYCDGALAASEPLVSVRTWDWDDPLGRMNYAGLQTGL